MEKILRIEGVSFNINEKEWDDHIGYRMTDDYDGYQIITDNQTIQIGISNSQDCCERFGCIITNDEIVDFIGSELLGVSITDTALNNKKIDELEYLDCGGAMFVNLETSKGLLQFVAYNAHNGYYGHETVLVSKQVNHRESL